MKQFKAYLKEAIKLNSTSEETKKKNVDFVNEFLDMGMPSPFERNTSLYIVNGVHVKVKLSIYQSDVMLDEIMVMNADIGEGAGSKIMKKLVDLADKRKVILSLFAEPLETPSGQKMPKSKLVNWYKKFGFVNVSSYMTRKPK